MSKDKYEYNLIDINKQRRENLARLNELKAPVKNKELVSLLKILLGVGAASAVAGGAAHYFLRKPTKVRHNAFMTDAEREERAAKINKIEELINAENTIAPTPLTQQEDTISYLEQPDTPEQLPALEYDAQHPYAGVEGYQYKRANDNYVRDSGLMESLLSATDAGIRRVSKNVGKSFQQSDLATHPLTYATGLAALLAGGYGGYTLLQKHLDKKEEQAQLEELATKRKYVDALLAKTLNKESSITKEAGNLTSELVALYLAGALALGTGGYLWGSGWPEKDRKLNFDAAKEQLRLDSLTAKDPIKLPLVDNTPKQIEEPEELPDDTPQHVAYTLADFTHPGKEQDLLKISKMLRSR